MPDTFLGGVPVVRSLVVVANSGRVLMGFQLRRQQWELPGGAIEPGESAHDAAVRELAEETGIRARELALVARAEFVLGSEATRHWAAVFNVTFDALPMTEANEEMADFRWWTVNTDLWEGLSPLDAEVARRCLPIDFAAPAIR
jgi:8-oxo-dGTP diphosphatase